MIDNIMRNAMNASWQLTDDFDFEYRNASGKKPIAPAAGISLNGQDIFDMCVKNIDMPQLSADVEEINTGGEFRLVAKKFQPFTISVTFRDVLSLQLRDYFIDIWEDQQNTYPVNIFSIITITSLRNLIFHTEHALITSVSQVQLDNSNSQIAEFTVEFKTPYYTNINGKFGDFGQTGFGKH